MIEDRLDNIETTLAHQEKQILDLGDMLDRQWKEIDRLKRHLENAYAKLDALENQAGPASSLSVSEQAARDKPPHY